MPGITILCGVILILIGAAGYVYGLMNGNASATALIPSAFGVLIAGLGIVARSQERLRKHIMHAVMLIALLGFLLPAGRMLSKFSDLTMSAALLSQLSMSIVCLALVIFGVRSFIAARQVP